MMTEELEQLLKNLQLRRVLEVYSEQLKAAEKEDVSYSEFLTRLMRAQWHARQEGALEWRIRRANLPERLSLETFPYARQPGVNRKQIRAFAELEFITKAENIVLVGPTGVGKTGLSCGLLLKALENGYRCQFVRAQDLFDEMYASLADRSTRQLLKRLARLDVPSDRRIWIFESETGAVQHFLQADGRTLPPACHDHHYEYKMRCSAFCV
jgi:DNA replication protein DnaC